ncbi:hypothetical protein [Nonomuraea jabiensis]|uniref:hypothetical protein n=1 Tax=Nonomuraea jabiensis TaxID=882448 RepID=UPI003D74F717
MVRQKNPAVRIQVLERVTRMLREPITFLRDALGSQAFAALNASPGARDVGHHAALRQLANHLVGILHGCLNRDAFASVPTALTSPNLPSVGYMIQSYIRVEKACACR